MADRSDLVEADTLDERARVSSIELVPGDVRSRTDPMKQTVNRRAQ